MTLFGGVVPITGLTFFMFCLLENIPMCYGLPKEEHENIVCYFEQKLPVLFVGLLYCVFISLPIQFDYLLVGNNRLLFCTFTHVASSLSSLKALHKCM